MSVSTPILTMPSEYWACADVLIRAATRNANPLGNLIAFFLPRCAPRAELTQSARFVHFFGFI
jgi:hypothetical protein